MITRPFGVTLIGAVCLVAGLVGVAGVWFATEARVPGTSPLAQLVTMAWSLTFILVSVLTWRRSRVAPLVFLVAMGLPVVLILVRFPRRSTLRSVAPRCLARRAARLSVSPASRSAISVMGVSLG